MTTSTTTNTMTDPAVSTQSPVVTTENTTVASPVVTEDPANPPAEGGDPAASGGDSNDDGGTPPAQDPANPATPADGNKNATPEWAQKRINELTAKRYEAERIAGEERDGRRAAEARAAELLKQVGEKNNAPPADPSATKPALTEAEIDRRALEKAALIAQATEFNKACNSVAETGKKDYKDWDDALKNLAMVGAIGDKVSPEFLENVVELKSPAKILHHLGTHMDEAARITQLSPKKMAMELVRIETALNAPAPIAPPAPLSNAPAPLIPVGGNGVKPGAPTLDDPNVSSADWFKMRDQQVMEKRNRYVRV